MAPLGYAAIMSLDGYVEDADGSFDWAEPDEEVHAFVNELLRPVGTYLYGRRMYETMRYWEDPPDLADQPSVVRDFAALWQAADKVVYSRTLGTASTQRTRIVRTFDPNAVRRLKAEARGDITIAGPELAAAAFAAGLVDEAQLFVVPVLVGGGKKALPDGVRTGLELLDVRRFASGMVFLRYRIGPRGRSRRGPQRPVTNPLS